MKPWIKTAFTLLIGFLLGVTATGLVIHQYFRPHHPAGLQDADRILKRLSSRLDLNPGQKEKVALLLQQELPKSGALRKESDVKFKALRDSFNTQLRAILDAGQQKKLDDMVAKWEQKQKTEARFLGCDNGPVSAAAVTGN
jgi:hypothetical protein